jgi:large subunit ribosomal protein LP0
MVARRATTPLGVFVVCPLLLLSPPRLTHKNARPQTKYPHQHASNSSIEIVADVHLIKQGDKVGASQAALLGKLGVRPFKYGLEIMQVFENGALFDPKVLDLTDDVLLERVAAAVANVAALSLAANYPTLASVPHSVVDGYKNVLAIALATEYSFPLADKVKEILKNPGAFAAAAAPAAAAAGGGKAEAKKEEPEEEEEEDMGFSLFD